VQLTGRNKGTNVVPGHRHDLRRGQLVLIQNILNDGVERKPKAVIESDTVDRNGFSGLVINGRICLRITKVYHVGRRYFFSRVVFFKVGTTFGLGK